MHIDEHTCVILQRIRDKAITHAEKCIDDGSRHSAGEWMDIARDADKIIRKSWIMKNHPNQAH